MLAQKTSLGTSWVVWEASWAVLPRSMGGSGERSPPGTASGLILEASGGAFRRQVSVRGGGGERHVSRAGGFGEVLRVTQQGFPECTLSSLRLNPRKYS